MIHRRNIDRLAQMIDLAETLGAERVELANAQFYGWAFSIARRCCQLGNKSLAREKSPSQPKRGSQVRSTSFMCSRTITKPGLNRVLTAGASVILQSIQLATCSRARLLLPQFPISHSKMSGRARSIGSGANRKASTGFAERNGCRSRARVVRKKKSISADAVVRPRC